MLLSMLLSLNMQLQTRHADPERVCKYAFQSVDKRGASCFHHGARQSGATAAPIVEGGSLTMSDSAASLRGNKAHNGPPPGGPIN